MTTKDEFDMQKELIEFDKKAEIEVEKIRHKNALQEIEKEKQAKIDVENLKHRNDLETGRMKSAEIRKTIERKKDLGYMNNYPRGQQ